MNDMIDLSTVTIHNSPDIHAWPATTTITRLELRPSGVHVEFTKNDGADRWPDFPFGDAREHGNLQYTLWIVLCISEQWHAAGCIEFWFGLDESGGPVDEYSQNWYYDANRWAPMTGHQPAPGERVGFLITSGDARHGDEAVGLHERSNIVAIDFPTAAGAVFTFDAAPSTPAPAPTPAVPGPAPVPVPAPTPARSDETRPTEDDLLALFNLFEELVHNVERIADTALMFEARCARLEALITKA